MNNIIKHIITGTICFALGTATIFFTSKSYEPKQVPPVACTPEIACENLIANFSGALTREQEKVLKLQLLVNGIDEDKQWQTSWKSDSPSGPFSQDIAKIIDLTADKVTVDPLLWLGRGMTPGCTTDEPKTPTDIVCGGDGFTTINQSSVTRTFQIAKNVKVSVLGTMSDGGIGLATSSVQDLLKKFNNTGTENPTDSKKGFEWRIFHFTISNGTVTEIEEQYTP